MKVKRVERCKMLLNIFKKSRKAIIIFSDEKYFVVDAKRNRQNDRVLMTARGDKNDDDDDADDEDKYVSTTKHPASVMMFGCVASTGEKCPPVYFPQGFRLGAADYLPMLKTRLYHGLRCSKSSIQVVESSGSRTMPQPTPRRASRPSWLSTWQGQLHP